MAVPMPACEKANVGVPERLTSSVAWIPERVGDAGTLTLPVAAVDPSYTRFDAVYVPTIVRALVVMFAVAVADVLAE